MISFAMFIDYVCYNNKLRPVKNICAVDSGDGAVIHADLLCIKLNTVEDLDSLCIELNNTLHSVASEFIPTAKYKPYRRPKWTPTAKTQHNTERRPQKLWISEGRPREMEHETNVRNEPNTEYDLCISDVFKDIDDIDDEAPERDIRLFWKLK